MICNTVMIAEAASGPLVGKSLMSVRVPERRTSLLSRGLDSDALTFNFCCLCVIIINTRLFAILWDKLCRDSEHRFQPHQG